MALPPGESFTLEYVTNKPWSGYNWYQGNFSSLIQINTDLPIYIDRAVDLACHEGYPGHHVYNALLEKHLVRDRGWVEFTVYPLFSPQSLDRRGNGELRHRGRVPRTRADRLRTRHAVPGGRDRSGRGPPSTTKCRRSSISCPTPGNEAARQLIDGKITADQAAAYLEKYALYSPERAKQRVTFIEKYRSYVINYNFGKDLVRRFLESRGGTADQPARRWSEFGKLLSSPRLPSGLQ